MEAAHMYQCPQCSYLTDHRKNLEKHILAVHEGQTLFCGQNVQRIIDKILYTRFFQIPKTQYTKRFIELIRLCTNN